MLIWYITVTTLRVVWIEIALYTEMLLYPSVTTLRVVWIEISATLGFVKSLMVTTLRVVWIEIYVRKHTANLSASPPCGWCGLKYI